MAFLRFQGLPWLMGRQDSRFIVFRRCRSAFSKQWMAFCFYHCDKAEASSEVMSRGRSSLRIGRQCREFAASIGKPALLPEESKAALHVLQVALDLTMLHSFVPSLYYSNFPRPPPPQPPSFESRKRLTSQQRDDVTCVCHARACFEG